MLESETQPSFREQMPHCFAVRLAVSALSLPTAALQKTAAGAGCGCWNATQTQWKQTGPDSAIGFSSLA